MKRDKAPRPTPPPEGAVAVMTGVRVLPPDAPTTSAAVVVIPEPAAPAVLTDVRVTPLDADGVPNGPTVHLGPQFALAYVPELPELGATPGDVLIRLQLLAGNIGTLTELLDAAYAARIGLWKAGRAMDPPVTQRVLGQASGVSDVAIAKKLREIS